MNKPQVYTQRPDVYHVLLSALRLGPGGHGMDLPRKLETTNRSLDSLNNLNHAAYDPPLVRSTTSTGNGADGSRAEIANKRLHFVHPACRDPARQGMPGRVTTGKLLVRKPQWRVLFPVMPVPVAIASSSERFDRRVPCCQRAFA